MSKKEIAQCQLRLHEILEMPEDKQNQPLRDLARKVGAQQPNASGIEFRDMIVNNINHAIQTATMVSMCKTSSKNCKISIIAAIAAALSALAAWFAVMSA